MNIFHTSGSRSEIQSVMLNTTHYPNSDSSPFADGRTTVCSTMGAPVSKRGGMAGKAEAPTAWNAALDGLEGSPHITPNSPEVVVAEKLVVLQVELARVAVLFTVLAYRSLGRIAVVQVGAV